jgi:outer membrane protein OmpA-like peptidoglycan-associated protein
VAGRNLQELEARVREREALDSCVKSTSLAGRYGEARDKALRATLDLERSLKADLRDELEKARQEALDRQADMYDALQKLEGRFATITKNARGTIVSLADILFDFNKATLKRDVEFNLVKIATILEQFPEMNIQVEGHTDNVGTPEYNLDLSRRRAQAVADFMSTQGVDKPRLTVQGFGLTQPVADNATDAGRQKNRRVDLVINEKK